MNETRNRRLNSCGASMACNKSKMRRQVINVLSWSLTDCCWLLFYWFIIDYVACVRTVGGGEGYTKGSMKCQELLLLLVSTSFPINLFLIFLLFKRRRRRRRRHPDVRVLFDGGGASERALWQFKQGARLYRNEEAKKEKKKKKVS